MVEKEGYGTGTIYVYVFVRRVREKEIEYFEIIGWYEGGELCEMDDPFC